MQNWYFQFLSICLVLLIGQPLYGQEHAVKVINEPGRHTAAHPMLTVDASTLYFSRDGHPRNQGAANAADIWVRNRLSDGSWGRALNAGSPINSMSADRVMGISADSRRLAVARQGVTSYLDLLERGDRSWRIKESYSLPVQAGELLDGTYDLESRKLIFVRTIDGQTDLFEQTARVGGVWSAATPLHLINSPAAEQLPYLAPDGQSLYFRRGTEWWLSRYDANAGTFGTPISISAYLPEQLRELTFSVTDSNLSIGARLDERGNSELFTMQLPAMAKPAPSRLLNGRLTIAQSPDDRVNGASVRAVINGRERQLYPDNQGQYVLIVPEEGTVHIDANAPGYFAPGQSLVGQQELDGTINNDAAAAADFSVDYYAREAAIQQLHRNIASTEAELERLQYERRRVSERIRQEQIAAGQDVLAGFSDPELEQLRYRLSQAQGNLQDTVPPGMTPRGVAAPKPIATDLPEPMSIDELEAMKVRFRAQQNELLEQRGGQPYQWRDENPAQLRKEVARTVNEEIVPSISRELAADVFPMINEDSLALDQNIRQSLFPPSKPSLYGPADWERELLSDLRPATEADLRARLREPIQDGLVADARLQQVYDKRTDELGLLQDSLDRALDAQLAEENAVFARQPQRSFTAKGIAASPETYQSMGSANLELIPLNSGRSMVLRQLSFEPNTIVFKPESYVELDRLVQLLRNNPGLKIEVGAHTNAGLSYLEAQELSNGRAKAVVDYLSQKGIEGGRAFPRGFGRERPIVENNTSAGRARNQRIEITIL